MRMNMPLKVEVFIGEVCKRLTLDLELNYEKGLPSTRWDPPEPEELELLHVSFDGRDIDFLFDKGMWRALEAEALERIRSVEIEF